MNPAEPADGSCIYQLRIVLRDISPLIWRRVQVRSDICIADLHDVLQIVMDWDDIHLHRFCIHGKDYGIARCGGMGFADDPRQVRLCDFRLHRRERFLYEYDFTDNWVLEIRLEDGLKPKPGQHYPVCTAGRRAAPPRDAAALEPTREPRFGIGTIRRWRLSSGLPRPCKDFWTPVIAPPSAIRTRCERHWNASKRTMSFNLIVSTVG